MRHVASAWIFSKRHIHIHILILTYSLVFKCGEVGGGDFWWCLNLWLAKCCGANTFQNYCLWQPHKYHSTTYNWRKLLETNSLISEKSLWRTIYIDCTAYFIAVQLIYNSFSQFISQAQLYSKLQISSQSDPNALGVLTSK